MQALDMADCNTHVANVIARAHDRKPDVNVDATSTHHSQRHHHNDHPCTLLLAPGGATLVSTPATSHAGSPCHASHDATPLGTPTHLRQASKRPPTDAGLHPGKRRVPTLTARLAQGTSKCLKRHSSYASHLDVAALDHAELTFAPMHAPPIPLYVAVPPRDKGDWRPAHLRRTDHGGIRCPSLQSQVGSSRACARLTPPALQALLPLAAARQPRCWNVRAVSCSMRSQRVQADVLVVTALATVAWRRVLGNMDLHKGTSLARLWYVVLCRAPYVLQAVCRARSTVCGLGVASLKVFAVLFAAVGAHSVEVVQEVVVMSMHGLLSCMASLM